MSAEVVLVPILTDNYACLVHEGDHTVVIDPTEAEPVIQALRQRKWKLDAVLNTHHHWDHVGGNGELAEYFGCEVIGPRGDRDRIPHMKREMRGGERLQIGDLSWDVLFIPGHTRHHVALWNARDGQVFTGDTLFLMGCGRLFEGTAEQMWASLSLLMALPDRTRVYCAHEYTEANVRFALSLTPEDESVVVRAREVVAKRRKGIPTVPGTLGEEKATNPFLRVADASFRERVHPGTTVEAFAHIRRLKDGFKA